MTVLHMVNCSLTAFAPHGALLWALSEDSPWPLAAMSGAFFLATQITKILLLVALPFPSGDETFHAVWECLKCIINLADVFGVAFLLRTRQALAFHDYKHRVLLCALGWALAESVASNVFSFLIGARTADFTWEYTLRAVLSNFNLISQILFTGFVFLWIQKDTQNRSLLAGSGAIHLAALPLISSYEKAGNLNADATFLLFCVRGLLLAISAFIVKNAYVAWWRSKEKTR